MSHFEILTLPAHIMSFVWTGVVSALGGRVSIIKLNDWAIRVFGYRATVVLFSPWIENAWIIIAAWGPRFGISLVASTAGYALQERLLFWPAMSGGLRAVMEFWLFAPAAFAVELGLFGACRARGYPATGFAVSVVLHAVWNFYWTA